MSAPFSTSVTASGHTVLITADKVVDLDFGIQAIQQHDKLVAAIGEYLEVTAHPELGAYRSEAMEKRRALVEIWRTAGGDASKFDCALARGEA